MRRFHPYQNGITSSVMPLYATKINNTATFNKTVTLSYNNEMMSFLKSDEHKEDIIVLTNEYMVSTRIEEARIFYKRALRTGWKIKHLF